MQSAASGFAFVRVRLERSEPLLHRTLLAECSTSSVRAASIIYETACIDMDKSNAKCGSRFFLRARLIGKIWASPSQNSPRGMFNFLSATCQHHMRDFIDMDECNAKCGSRFCVRTCTCEKIWASPSFAGG